MVAGYWKNQDGLLLQFGTQKAITEPGGEYLQYGPYRTIESYINLVPTQFGGKAGEYVQIPALPASFSGSSDPISAGIQSLTEFYPLQQYAIPAASSGVQTINTPQLYVDSIEIEVLIAANAGTGGATGVTIGLAYLTQNGASTAFAQAQVSGPTNITFAALTNAAMSANKYWRITSSGTITGDSATGVTAGNYIGNVAPTISFLNGSSGALATNAYMSTFCTSGGVYSGSAAAGLLKVRTNYCFYGSINQ